MLKDDAEWTLIQLGVTCNLPSRDECDFEIRLRPRSRGGFNISLPAELIDDLLNGKFRPPVKRTRAAAR